MQRKVQVTPRHLGSTLFCVAALLAGFLLVHPVLNTGFSDDFSYIYTAKRAAETGRMIYNGWACPLLGYMVYLAAFIIKLLGFSFTHVRAAVMLICLLNAAVAHRLFLRLVPNNFNAVVATLTVTFGPMAFGNSTIFFTDMPGMFAAVVALYCCVRAMQATTARDTVRWLIWAVLLNLFLGSVRQTAWMCALFMVPATGWYLRDRAGVLSVTIKLWIVSCVVVLAAVYWLAHQPYAPQEAFIQHYNFSFLARTTTYPTALLIESFPLLVAFLSTKILSGHRRLMVTSALVATAITAPFVWPHAAIAKSAEEAYLAAFHGILPTWPLFELALLWLGVLLASVITLLALHDPEARHASGDAVSFHTLIRMLAPYAIVSIGLAISRGSQWPRYILPLVPATSVLLYMLYAELTHDRRFPVLTASAVAVYMALVVAVTHDDYAERNAALRLLDRYAAQGMPRAQLEAGMDMDGWFEVATGHNINEPRIRVPAGSYHPRPMPARFGECHNYLLSYSPEIRPIYRLTEKQDPRCDTGAPLFADSGHVWLGKPRPYFIYRLNQDQQVP